MSENKYRYRFKELEMSLKYICHTIFLKIFYIF